MATCRTCAYLRKCIEKSTKEGYEHNVDFDASSGCPNFGFKSNTNADRIRAMSDEELARHLHCIGWDCHLCAEHRRLDNEPLLRGKKCDENCFEHCLEWLKQPAKEVEG